MICKWKFLEWLKYPSFYYSLAAAVVVVQWMVEVEMKTHDDDRNSRRIHGSTRDDHLFVLRIACLVDLVWYFSLSLLRLHDHQTAAVLMKPKHKPWMNKLMRQWAAAEMSSSSTVRSLLWFRWFRLSQHNFWNIPLTFYKLILGVIRCVELNRIKQQIAFLIAFNRFWLPINGLTNRIFGSAPGHNHGGGVSREVVS